MAGLVPGIHVFPEVPEEDVDGGERRQVYVVCAKQTTMPGHDGKRENRLCLLHPTDRRGARCF
jgi:hypothetical protein